MIRVFSQYISPKSFIRVILECGAIALALLCGTRIRFWNSAAGFDSYVTTPDFLTQAVAFVAVLQICLYYSDLYGVHMIHRRQDQAILLGHSLGIGCLLLGVLYFIFPNLLIGRGIWFISIVLVGAYVMVSRVALDRIWQAVVPKDNMVILGIEGQALAVARELARRDDLTVHLMGFINPRNGASDCGPSLLGRPILGTAEQLRSLVSYYGISRIVVAVEDRRNALPINDLVRLRVQGIRVEDAHSTIAALTGRVWLETVKPSWFVFSDGFQRSLLTLLLKRLIDLLCGLAGLLLTSPLMLLMAITIRLESKGAVIFRQTRVGLRGQPFKLLKFRSMRDDAEQLGAVWASENDPRVTRIGRFLRNYRLDELPQFVNIIRGQMSFVGPRPERPVFVEQLREEISYYDERHSVRPGLTGWAQVQYHYGSSLEDARRKMEYDLFYLKNLSIPFDCAIILRTIRIVLTGRGGR
jgi:sugar transferase (PEP-CTERM system associated)